MLVRDPTLREIMTSEFRLGQLFKSDTSENRKNGHLAQELVDLYLEDKDYFIENLLPAEGHVLTYLESLEMGKAGTLKVPVSFNVAKRKNFKMDISFSEPKKKVVKEIIVKEVVLPNRKNKNKNSLW